MIVTAGSTNVTVYVYFVEDNGGTNPGEPKTGLLFSNIETGGSASYLRQGETRTDFSLVTQTAAGAHTDGGFVEMDSTNMPGVYRLDLPDAAVADTFDWVVISLVAAAANNCLMHPLVIDLTNVDLRSAANAGITSLIGHTPQTGDTYALANGATGFAAIDTVVDAVKVKTDFLPSATAGAAGGVFIAGANAATSVTTAFTADITGNLSGSVGSVTGAVGSVTGAVGSVTGSVGSVVGHTAQTGDTFALANGAAGFVAIDTVVDSVKVKTDFLPNATAGAAGGVFIAGTNAATTITTALTTDITGNLSGSVGSVTGAVGSVTGAVGSVTAMGAGSIDAASLASGAIDVISEAMLPKQNEAFANISFLFVAASDHVTPVTGASGITLTRSIDGAAFGAKDAGTTISEVGNGIYSIDAAAADMNGGIITFRAVATGGTPGAPDDVFLTIVTSGGV